MEEQQFIVKQLGVEVVFLLELANLAQSEANGGVGDTGDILINGEGGHPSLGIATSGYDQHFIIGGGGSTVLGTGAKGSSRFGDNHQEGQMDTTMVVEVLVLSVKTFPLIGLEEMEAMVLSIIVPLIQ